MIHVRFAVRFNSKFNLKFCLPISFSKIHRYDNVVTESVAVIYKQHEHSLNRLKFFATLHFRVEITLFTKQKMTMSPILPVYFYQRIDSV